MADAETPYAVLLGGVFYPSGFRFEAKDAASDALLNFERDEVGRIDVRNMPAYVDHQKPRAGRWVAGKLDPLTNHAMSFGYAGPSDTPAGKDAVQGVLSGRYRHLSLAHKGTLVEASKNKMKVCKYPLEISYVTEPARDGSDITFKRPVNKEQFESFLRLVQAGCRPDSAAQLAGATDGERLQRGILLACSQKNWEGLDVLVNELVSRAKAEISSGSGTTNTGPIPTTTTHNYESKLDNQTPSAPTTPIAVSPSPQATQAILFARSQRMQQPQTAPATQTPVPAPAAQTPAAPAPAAQTPAPAPAPAQTPVPAAQTPAEAQQTAAAALTSMVDIVGTVPTSDVDGMRQLLLTMAKTIDHNKSKLTDLELRNQEFEKFAAAQRDEQRRKIEENQKALAESQLLDANQGAQLMEFFKKVTDSGLKDLPMQPAQAFETLVACGVGQKRKNLELQSQVQHHVQQYGQGENAAYLQYLKQAQQGESMLRQPVITPPVQPAQPMNDVQRAIAAAYNARHQASSPMARVADPVQYAEARAGVEAPQQQASAQAPQQQAQAQAQQQQTGLPQRGSMVHSIVNSVPNAAGTFARLQAGGMPAQAIEYFLANMNQS